MTNDLKVHGVGQSPWREAELERRQKAGIQYNGQSSKETAYLVHCPKHGGVFLTAEEYARQLKKADKPWTCPVMDTDMDELGLCGRSSEFDDEHNEKIAQENWGKQ